mmetsp:Transcript_26729/g.62781  ORF Transcript_26729/g.62781 Transcript_26729/m.62781 type:complete len:220 (+) Transcript_26729:178-837(+)
METKEIWGQQIYPYGQDRRGYIWMANYPQGLEFQNETEQIHELITVGVLGDMTVKINADSNCSRKRNRMFHCFRPMSIEKSRLMRKLHCWLKTEYQKPDSATKIRRREINLPEENTAIELLLRAIPIGSRGRNSNYGNLSKTFCFRYNKNDKKNESEQYQRFGDDHSRYRPNATDFGCSYSTCSCFLFPPLLSNTDLPSIVRHVTSIKIFLLFHRQPSM